MRWVLLQSLGARDQPGARYQQWVMEMEEEISQQRIAWQGAVMGNHLHRGWGIKGSRQDGAPFAGAAFAGISGAGSVVSSQGKHMLCFPW